ncbi:hypothetical protein AALP_AAs68488U000900 [Arabis alpina]|uniref:Ubiquitin-like protease family profile domain-containing protein n=1 Tax=Arabis alpina TaxID=50452 RepID=A0A087FY46_ARAAL|nr:hypothetical protein AALP_AAs68488U000900 [Arabis alpina]
MDEILELPERMFAAGEEPVGIRVTAYGPSCGIRTIMNALEEDERNIIRQSSFGKFVSIADKPAYSGRFGRFLISRQLKVAKKHEIWVLFAGHPIRISLREFAIVTEAVPALLEVTQLNSTSSSESDGDGEKEGPRGKKISLSPSHARELHEEEKTTVDCIISDDGEVEVNEKELVWSDDEEDVKVSNIMKLIGDEHQFSGRMFTGGATKSDVVRMIRDAKEKNVKMKQKKTFGQVEGCGESSNWEGITLSGTDIRQIADMVCEKVIDEMNKKEKDMLGYMRKELLSIETSVVAECCEHFSKSQGNVIDGFVGEVGKKMEKFKSDVIDGVGRVINKQLSSQGKKCGELREGTDFWQTTVAFTTGLNHQTSSQKDNAGVEDAGNGCNLSEVGDNTVGVDENNKARNPNPSFSLGLSQENTAVFAEVEGADGSGVEADLEVERAREVVFSSLGYGSDVEYWDRYQAIVEKIKEMMAVTLYGVSLSSKDFLDIAGITKSMPAKVVDLLMSHTRSVLGKQGSHRLKKSVFLDTKFVSSLVKQFPKFSKPDNKDEFQFQKLFSQQLSEENAAFGQAYRFYFPFNLDKTHWIGVCVDSLVSTVYILDCCVAMRSESSITKELKPIAELFPFLLKQLGRTLVGRGVKPFAVERLKCVPQNEKHIESAMTSVVLIQAHSIGGAEACVGVTPDVVPVEAQRISIMLFDELSVRL